MATKEKTRIVVVKKKEHPTIVRTYIEMRALYEAYRKAKDSAGGFKLVGSDNMWQQVRSAVENNKRAEYRKLYENEAYYRIKTSLDQCTTNGIQPYADTIQQMRTAAVTYRRLLDMMIEDEMEYARRQDKLYGILGRLATVVKAGSDITMSILGAVLPGPAAEFVGTSYSVSMDVIGKVSDSSKADEWWFEGTGKGWIVGKAHDGIAKYEIMEFTKKEVKYLKMADAVTAVAQTLLEAEQNWKKFD